MMAKHVTDCPKCGSLATYNERYDAYHCCGEWLEKACDESQGCEFCTGRPERLEIEKGASE